MPTPSTDEARREVLRAALATHVAEHAGSDGCPACPDPDVLDHLLDVVVDALGEIRQGAVDVAQVTHWQIVNDETGGISYSISSREEWPAYKAEERALGWLRPGTHLEVWTQTWFSTDAVWERIS